MDKKEVEGYLEIGIESAIDAMRDGYHILMSVLLISMFCTSPITFPFMQRMVTGVVAKSELASSEQVMAIMSSFIFIIVGFGFMAEIVRSVTAFLVSEKDSRLLAYPFAILVFSLFHSLPIALALLLFFYVYRRRKGLVE